MSIKVVGGKMNNIKYLILVSLLLLVSNPLSAHIYPKSHIDTAEKLLESVNYEKIMEQQINASIEVMKKKDPTTALYEKKIRSFYRSTFDHKEIKAILVELYAENFTEVELQELIRFNQSSVGKKMHSKNALINEVLLKHLHEKFQLQIEKNHQKK